MSIRSRALFLMLSAMPILAQPTSAGEKQNTTRATSIMASKPQGLTVDGILAMVEAGLTDDVIIARLRKEDRAFDLSPDEMIRVKKAKVSDAVLMVMLDPKVEIKPSVVQSAAPPAPIATPQRAAVQTPPPPMRTRQAAAQQPDNSQPHTNPLRKLANATKKMEDWAGGKEQSGPMAVDAAGLRRILPPFDRNKSASEQFPHVAVTVLKSPPMWSESYLHLGSLGDRSSKYESGCFTLRAVVWSDPDHSKTVGPFDWCSPRDVEIEPGPQSIRGGLQTSADRFSNYLTGVTRTDGPRPPDTLAPDDRDTQELYSKNNRGGGARDLSKDIHSRFALMFFNLRYAMGENLTDGDFRVWIVAIH